jgi:hypothetical protein
MSKPFQLFTTEQYEQLAAAVSAQWLAMTEGLREALKDFNPPPPFARPDETEKP